MEIKIIPKPVVEARLNLINFEKDMKSHFNIKKAVFDNLKITNYDDQKIKNSQSVKSFIYMAFDWGNLLMLYSEDNLRHDFIDIKMHECHIRDLTNYSGRVLDTDNGLYSFKEVKEDVVDFLLTNSFNKELDKHIEYMLSQHLINYGKEQRKVIVSIR